MCFSEAGYSAGVSRRPVAVIDLRCQSQGVARIPHWVSPQNLLTAVCQVQIKLLHPQINQSPHQNPHLLLLPLKTEKVQLINPPLILPHHLSHLPPPRKTAQLEVNKCVLDLRRETTDTTRHQVLNLHLQVHRQSREIQIVPDLVEDL